MIYGNSKIKALGIFSAMGILGMVGMQFVPQVSAKTSLAAASYGYSSSQEPAALYSTPAELVSPSASAQINVRRGPGTNYGVRHYGLGGDRVTLLSDDNGSDGYRWYYLQFEQSGAKGWVREDLISEGGGHPQPEQYVLLKSSNPDARINVRSGPGTNYAIRHYGLNGDPVSLLNHEEGQDGSVWYELSFVDSGAIGWVREDLLEFVAD